MIRLPQLGAAPDAPFPPARSALQDPNGLLAWGGDLHPQRLLNAYRHGVFPWFTEGEPILWWSPDPRMVFDTASFALSRRMRRSLRTSTWQIHADRAFDHVVEACAHAPRNGQHGTWITAGMRAAYGDLHRLGHAHSIEVYEGSELVGGLYGVHSGGVFCGESMFSARSGGSKVALAAACRVLATWGIALLDAQVENPHLVGLGAQSMERDAYLRSLTGDTASTLPSGSWAERFPSMSAAALA